MSIARLFIAEKPSLGRAIAAALPKPHQKQNGYIQAANGDVVTWCIGHLLEQVEPDAYDPRYKKWQMQDLPIIPDTWQLRPRASAKSQLNVIKTLLKQKPAQIIHAGDPDREGQLLVDEVIHHLKVSKTMQAKIQRLLISDLNFAAVKRSLSSMRSNQDFIPLSVSALARSRADWLYGMNMTRAYTLLGQKAGYQGVLSVGRVQTPVLGLVVRREIEIENFKPHDYYQLDALIPYQNQQGESFDIRARWQPSEHIKPHQDEEGRVLNKALVEHIAKKIQNQAALVKAMTQKQSQQAPPLPYALSKLQIEAARAFGMSAQHVLDVCQALYEKHKLITYPRSDCQYLPLEHLQQAPQVSAAIAHNDPQLASSVSGANLSLKSSAWNDSKVDAHHGIIPTPRQVNPQQLSADESKIYQMIARQYLYQFYPKAVYAHAQLDFEIQGGLFIAKGRQLIKPGWREIMPKSKAKQEKSSQDQEEFDKVPVIEKGSQLTCREGEVKALQTEPPRYFNEASLLQAMTGIARFVQDKSLKKILRETDGLGTEATRAGILDTLFKRALLKREGKQVRATQAGRGLVLALPDLASFPDMTAHWEHQLQDMADKKQAYQPFMQHLNEQVSQLMAQVQSQDIPMSLRNLPQVKPSFKKKRTYKRRPSKAK